MSASPQEDFDVSDHTSFKPTIPDSVVNYCMRKSGFECDDERAAWLVAVAAQRFALEVAYSAKACHDLKAGGKTKGTATLSKEDLAQGLQNTGVSVSTCQYMLEPQ